MCLSHSSEALAEPPLVRDDDDTKAFSTTLDAMGNRPAWTLRGVLKRPASTGRPGIPRRFYTKINLNEHWGALEKLVKVDVSWTTPRHDAMDVDNEVNDNLANERLEAEHKMDIEIIAPSLPTEGVAEVQSVATPLIQPPEDIVEEEVVPDMPVLAREDVTAKVQSTLEMPILTREEIPAEVQAEAETPHSSGRREKGRRRRSAPPAAACGPPCGPQRAPSPCLRVPLGTLNGIQSRGQLRKSLSPLSAFADNLARRLARQH